MKQTDETAKTIDYRSPAIRISDRARTSKSSFLAIGTAIAIVLGLAVYSIAGN
ncbi:MAG: hypothetical protein ABWY64_12580 [Tardiphaga sp.]